MCSIIYLYCYSVYVGIIIIRYVTIICCYFEMEYCVAQVDLKLAM